MTLSRRSQPPITAPVDIAKDLHQPPCSPSLSISTSTTGSPTSSLSLSEHFDSGGAEGVRIESARKDSMGESLHSIGKEEGGLRGKFALGIDTGPPPIFSNLSFSSTPSPESTSSGPLTPSTPDSLYASSADEDSPRFENSSPSGSIASTAKDGLTPRAELAQPIWPLSSTQPTERRQTKSRLNDEAKEGFAVETTLARSGSLKRDGSWRRKHASLDTPPTIPNPVGAFASFSDLRSTSPIPEMAYASGGQVPSSESSFPPTSPQSRRHSEIPNRHAQPGAQILAASTTTGCCISAPISPPAHYPIPMSASSSSSGTRGRTPSSPRSTIASSVSSGSSGAKLADPPRWAQPPTRANRISVRAGSFGDAILERPDLDFDPELFESTEGDEEIEVIKGTEGRIAVKATKSVYEILVWLPGFTLDNITIATRGARTIHIVADQWEEGDHAQWDIKLGDDANMRSIGAKFGGQDLKITVAREQRRKTSSRSRLGREPVQPLRSSTSNPATPAQPTTATMDPPPSTPAEPADYWASQWSPHPMTRRVHQSSTKTI